MKKSALELSELIKSFGYWSDEVFNFNNGLIAKYGYIKYLTIHNNALIISKS